MAKEGQDEKRQTYYTGGEKSGMMVEDSLQSENIVQQLLEKSKQAARPEPAEEDAHKVTRSLTFYRDGFTIEDSELFEYSDPRNRQILEDFKAGHALFDLDVLRLISSMSRMTSWSISSSNTNLTGTIQTLQSKNRAPRSRALVSNSAHLLLPSQMALLH